MMSTQASRKGNEGSMTKKPNMVGKVVVVRSGQSGVHVGKLVAREGDRVTLEKSTRLWYWKVAQTTGQVSSCSEIATYGVKLKECKVGATLPLCEVGGVCEIIPLTKAAQETFKESAQ